MSTAKPPEKKTYFVFTNKFDDGELGSHALLCKSEYDLNAMIEFTKRTNNPVGLTLVNSDYVDMLEAKLAKLKQLMLLTDPAFSTVITDTLQVSQWNEFIRMFPDEA